jgi:hypothetical protein
MSHEPHCRKSKALSAVGVGAAMWDTFVPEVPSELGPSWTFSSALRTMSYLSS